MAILRIIQYPDPVLRQKAKKIKNFDSKLRKLSEDMLETMHYKDRGVGLAAPQVDKSIRLIVCFDPTTQNNYVLCNPNVIKETGQQVCREACLSFSYGEIVKEVKRPKKIIVEYQNIEGAAKTLVAENLLCEIIVHELEHLNGVLLCDSQDKKFSGGWE